jgi:hypothetical protein
VERLFQLKYDLGRIRNFKEQLPIHKAFAYIPAGSSRLHSRHLQTVNALLRMNPETASLPDLNNCLPLHLAVYYNASLEVVQAVYNGKFGGSRCYYCRDCAADVVSPACQRPSAVYPSATLVKDNTGRLPVHYVNDPEVRKLLMKASAPLARAGITDSFARFVT